MPNLPPGFKLDQPEGLPQGFELDAPKQPPELKPYVTGGEEPGLLSKIGKAFTGEDMMTENIEGSYVVPPGGFWCMAAQGAAAAASAHTSSFLWEEVPLL